MVAENEGSQLWHQTEAGGRIVESEKKNLAEPLSRLPGYHLVFLGDLPLAHTVYDSLISHRILLNPKAKIHNETVSSLTADMDAIPLLSDSVDVVVLSHVLEQVDNPHEVLREAHRVLIPEGHVIITGFNPYSLWGIWHAWQKLTGKMPRQGKLLSMMRLRDWLNLLNFQIVAADPFHFRPPVLHHHLGFFEKWGKNGWLIPGGAYTLLAVKRVVPLNPVRAKWHPEPIWRPVAEGLPKPTTTARYDTEEN